MTDGPAFFVQPLREDDPVLDGVVLEGVPFREAALGAGASLLEMWDGSRVIQIDYRAQADPVNPLYKQWSFVQQATIEAQWLKVAEVHAFALPVWWVPYTAVTEAFIAADSQTSCTLRRPTAISKYTSFDETTYPPRAWLNGTEQTIVTGAPSAGEIKISVQTVTTPALAANDKLLIRYYPAYAVLVADFDEDFGGHNALLRQVVLFEANRQTPS